MYTLSDIIQDCVNEVKTDPNKRIWGDDMWTYYINQGIRQVERDGGYDWAENDSYYAISTIGGTEEYTLPTDLIKIEDVVLDNSTLTQTSKNYTLKMQANSSKPTAFYLRGNKIGFYSIPDTTYTVKVLYKKRISALSSDNTDLELDDDFVPAIVKYAVYLAWSSPRGNYNEAQSKLNDYKIAIDRLFASRINRSNANFTFSQSRGTQPYNDKVVF